MDDLLRYFSRGAEIAIEQHIGLFVELFARGEHCADFAKRIGIVEQGTMRLIFDALEDFFWRKPEAEHE